jgi:hypothetical protein
MAVPLWGGPTFLSGWSLARAVPDFFSGGPSRGRSRYSVSIDRMLVIFLLGVVWVGPSLGRSHNLSGWSLTRVVLYFEPGGLSQWRSHYLVSIDRAPVFFWGGVPGRSFFRAVPHSFALVPHGGGICLRAVSTRAVSSPCHLSAKTECSWFCFLRGV